MIFNKNNNGSQELRTLTGSYYKSNDFDKISVKIELASEDLINLIGDETFAKAEQHYQSVNYQVDSPTPELAFMDQLVQHIQLPIAFQATMWHYQGNDVSHEDSGRKVKISSDSEKMAWEWMFDRDDAAALRNYQRAFDRLIRFLNANTASIEEWANSDARKKALSLFINTAEQFDEIFPIDSSPVFYLRLVPIMRRLEKKHIKPIIGSDKYTALKDLIASGGDITAPDQDLIDYICDALPWLTMSKAMKQLSITVIPEGVVQSFFSERQTSKANIPATLDLVNGVSKSLWNDGLSMLDDVKKYWSSLNVDETDEDITDMLPSMDTTDKFISL